MPGDPKPTLTVLTEEAVLAAAFDRLRPRLMAMIARRISSKLAVRIDPEEVLQEAYLRAMRRRQDMGSGPTDLDAWVYRQVNDRLIELIRGALGPERDVDRDLPWPDGSAAPLAEHLVDSHTGPETALSRAERCAVVRTALEKLDPVDREILALRYFDGLGYDQIAVILGIEKLNTVNQRALRALMKLRKLIPRSLRPLGEIPS
jgi:RNA polymerase sigma-70 factor (ECF subfamily)